MTSSPPGQFKMTKVLEVLGPRPLSCMVPAHPQLSMDFVSSPRSFLRGPLFGVNLGGFLLFATM